MRKPAADLVCAAGRPGSTVRLLKVPAARQPSPPAPHLRQRGHHKAQRVPDRVQAGGIHARLPQERANAMRRPTCSGRRRHRTAHAAHLEHSCLLSIAQPRRAAQERRTRRRSCSLTSLRYTVHSGRQYAAPRSATHASWQPTAAAAVEAPPPAEAPSWLQAARTMHSCGSIAASGKAGLM